MSRQLYWNIKHDTFTCCPYGMVCIVPQTQQDAVSLHKPVPGKGGGGILANQKLKVPRPHQMFIFGGRGGEGGIFGKAKLKVSSPDQTFVTLGGGGVVLRTPHSSNT